MKFKIDESEAKLRGGYYTPSDVSRFLARWVLQERPSTLLEPSCGDGSFIRALKGLHRHSLKLTAVELVKSEAKKAAQAAAENKLLRATVKHGDFLSLALQDLAKGVRYDAVIGNPPYIRYQYMEPEDQVLSERIFAAHSLPFTKHTNAWVPFVIAGIDLLEPGGRLAMVIPSEILHVLHAASLRRHLLAKCARIFMIDPNDLLFDQALQGTVLLMVEKKRHQDERSEGVAVTSVPNRSFLDEDPASHFAAANYINGDVLDGKWMKVFLTRKELSVFEAARALPNVHRFGDIAKVDVGIVTGANKFFLVDDATVRNYGLEKYAHPMFGRSEHCPGVIYDRKTHRGNVEKGLPSSFLLFDSTPRSKLPKRVREYLEMGESERLDQRYKCRIRKPWYVVPSVYATPVGMLKRSHNFPRLIHNEAGAYTTDTAYRVQVTTNGISATQLVHSFVNSLTALTAELEGRHYGGGVLELVPSEIEKLLVPVPAKGQPDLSQLDSMVRSGQGSDEILKRQDDHILAAVGLSQRDIAVIHEGWRRVRMRRQRMLGRDMDEGRKDE